ncbi:olfactory receptor 5AR1-like isoform X1 [Lithobates pipiens]
MMIDFLEMNKSSVMTFIFTGLTEKTEFNILLFIVFLHVYVTTVVGNVGIIVLSIIDKHLHKPMYLFLCNLSFVDLMYSSAVTPKMLRDLLSETKTISFFGCAVQMHVFVFSATNELLLLGVMAYDRYVAICSPLLYEALMSSTLCLWMLVAAYCGGFANSLVQTISTFYLSFCRSNVIDHFFCDLPPLLRLSCSDISMNLAFQMILGGLITTSSIILILFSYSNIVLAILKIRSAKGKYKAFKTCASHMTTVSVFYGTIFFMYLRPNSSYAPQKDRVTSVFYTILIPMLNPLIYSLRNTDVKNGLRSSFKCCI